MRCGIRTGDDLEGVEGAGLALAEDEGDLRARVGGPVVDSSAPSGVRMRDHKPGDSERRSCNNLVILEGRVQRVGGVGGGDLRSGDEANKGRGDRSENSSETHIDDYYD